MGGIIAIRGSIFWAEASWIHNNIVSAIAENAAAENPDLSKIFHDSVTERGGYCDLSSLQKNAFSIIIIIIRDIFDDYLMRGAGSFTKITFYSRFMWSLSDLRLMLRSDPRSGESHERTCAIVNNASQWHVPAWGFDRQLEQLAIRLLEENDIELAGLLLTTTKQSGNKRFDLSTLDDHNRGRITETVTFMQQFVSQKRIETPNDPVYDIIDKGYDKMLEIACLS